MKVYNTLTRKKEDFIPMDAQNVKMYACGPTVYNYIHIGNARPLIVFDMLRRYMEFCGMKVKFVQNFTDVDDKIIRRANEEGISSTEVAEKYIAEFKKDAKGLNVREATVHPKATEHIEDIKEIVQKLIENGYAYESEGSVYYSTKNFKPYGKLSHQPLDELEAGARIDISEHKKDPMDFALWKAAKPDEPYWDSAWGKGRPGWHIECSAMARKHLGDTIDLHCGGQDLIFPHHENEIAQSEAANCCDFSRYWMHNGFINVDNEKMSKSKGNFFTVRDVAEEFGYEPIRFMMLSVHYRSPMNYSIDVITQAKAALTRLYTCRENLEFALKNATSGEKTDKYEKYIPLIKEQLDDDFNTAGAIGVLFDLVRDINTDANTGASKETLESAKATYDALLDLFGFCYEKKQEEDEDSAEIEAMIAKRTEAKKAKNYAEADAIRDELKAKGIVLEDTPQGVKWKRV